MPPKSKPSGNSPSRSISTQGMENRNRIITGQPGYGKSTSVIADALPLCLSGEWSVVMLDLHGTTAMELNGHCIAEGIGSRLVPELLHATDRVMGAKTITRSDKPNELQRRMENNEIIQATTDVLTNRR